MLTNLRLNSKSSKTGRQRWYEFQNFKQRRLRSWNGTAAPKVQLQMLFKCCMQNISTSRTKKKTLTEWFIIHMQHTHLYKSCRFWSALKLFDETANNGGKSTFGQNAKNQILHRWISFLKTQPDWKLSALNSRRHSENLQPWRFIILLKELPIGQNANLRHDQLFTQSTNLQFHTRLHANQVNSRQGN